MNLERLNRPLPPEELRRVARRSSLEVFEPCELLANWIGANFIEPTGPLFRAEHKHLKRARIGCLWTNTPLKIKQQAVAATAEMPSAQGNTWARARFKQQLREWFGFEPDFLLTFYAPSCHERDDAAFCALVRHELLHCAQKRTSEGELAFDRDGKPVFVMRGHDVEEFVAVAEDFGVDCCAGLSAAFVRAAMNPPKIARAKIALACGHCLK